MEAELPAFAQPWRGTQPHYTRIMFRCGNLLVLASIPRLNLLTAVLPKHNAMAGLAHVRDRHLTLDRPAGPGSTRRVCRNAALAARSNASGAMGAESVTSKTPSPRSIRSARPGDVRRSLQSPQGVDEAMDAIGRSYTHLHRLSRGQQAFRLMPSSSFELRLLPGCTLTQRQGLRDRITQGKSHFQSHRSASQAQHRDR